MDDFAPFARLLGALRPWLGHLVVIGGWAHRLHRFLPLAHPPAYLPLRTRDADLAFAPGARPTGDIGAALEEAGFRAELLGDHTPAVTHYHLGEADAGFYVEFLTPLHGGERKRGGRSDATLSKAGITAQKLRHLELLLFSPWVVTVGPRAGAPWPGTWTCSRGREGAGRALRSRHARALRSLAGLAARDLFREMTDTTREAARIPRDRKPMPDHIRAACRYGLEQILGALD